MLAKTMKFILYVVIFYFVGYYYATFTKGTVFDNFFIMLISLFLIIFLFESIISYFRKKGKTKHAEDAESDDETYKELIDGVKKDLDRSWSLKYKEIKIQIFNKYNQEELYVNDKLVDKKKRSKWYSWVTPYQILTHSLEDNGQPLAIKVKLGGLLSLNCKVYINNELVFKEKLKYNFIENSFKEKD